MTTQSFWPTLFLLKWTATLFLNFAWLSIRLLLKPSSRLFRNCLRFSFISLEMKRSLFIRKISSDSLTCLQRPTAPWAHCVAVPPDLLHPTVAILLTYLAPGAPHLFPCFPNAKLPAASWERVHEIQLFRLQSATCWGITFWIRIHLLSGPKTPLCWVLVVKRSGANMIYDSRTFGQNLFVFCLSGNS